MPRYDNKLKINLHSSAFSSKVKLHVLFCPKERYVYSYVDHLSLVFVYLYLGIRKLKKKIINNIAQFFVQNLDSFRVQLFDLHLYNGFTFGTVILFAPSLLMK